MMGTVGQCSIVPNDIEPGIMDSHLLRLEIDEKKYSKELLVQLISSSSIIRKQIKQLSVGGIMEGLSSNIVKKLIFPYPPIQEQNKIANILSSVDEAIEKKREIIENTKELKKGFMQELLIRGISHTKFKKTEIGEIPVDWEMVSTIDILKKTHGSIKIGPFDSQLKKEYFVQSGYKVYGQENVFNNDFTVGNRRIDKERFELLSSFQLYPGDIVITMMGTIGRCAVVPDDFEPGIMDSHLLRLEIDENRYSKELLVQLISNSSIIKKQIKQLSVGGIMEGLSSNIVKKLIFPCPPVQEQKRIAGILLSADQDIQKEAEQEGNLEILKNGLAEKLLAGKLRVYNREDKTRRKDEAEFLKDLLGIKKQEEKRGETAKEKSLDSDEYAFYGMFAPYGKGLFGEDDKKRCELAREIVRSIRGKRVVDWTEKEDVKKEMRREIKDLLRNIRFPAEEIERFVRELIELAEKRF